MARDEGYRNAEAKIEEARRTGATELDLSFGWGDDKSPKLTELPKSLGQLTQLQTLNLSNNQLTALPEWLGQLTQLQSLNLSNNKLTALPESLGQLTQLHTLNLSNNQLTALPEWLGQLTQLQSLNLSNNKLTALPESLGQLTQLQSLNLSNNKLTALPESLGQLTQLRALVVFDNQLTTLPTLLPLELSIVKLAGNPLGELPDILRKLKGLTELVVWRTQLTTIPDWIGELTRLKLLIFTENNISEIPDSLAALLQLETLHFGHKGYEGNPIRRLPEWLGNLSELAVLDLCKCELSDLPTSFAQLENLRNLDLLGNPLNPELAAAYKDGLDAVKTYLRAKAEDQIVLNEAKLILIGEGEVGKSCLLGALRGDEWVEGRDTTHGIEIKPVLVTDPTKGTEITLNGWDFGGQRVYRPTHQLFFSAPAIYLVVWKPREGSQAGAVKEWIELVKNREPDAKIIVVATHGGPKERQPDIDKQELWDLFGKDTVIDFFHVDSQPPKENKKTGKRTGTCQGVKELQDAIARVAAALPEMGRTVPKSWKDAREALKKTKAPYLPLQKVIETCVECKMEEQTARLFVTVSRTLGHLIHYDHDPVLRDIVILKPDWLATAISFVLDDKETREIRHGLVSFARLGQLWNDPQQEKQFRYDPKFHPIFLRLMERYDLSYRIAGLPAKNDEDETSLIAQLVPDVRPQADLKREWLRSPSPGDAQQVQICQIVDDKGQSAAAEGLLYQLIVRLHRYSLGREDYARSIHWQRGLVLEDAYGARALVEHIGYDIRLTVRSPYPERFLSALTYDVKWLVENFWTGLRCNVMVPCIEPCGRKAPGTGLFDVENLIDSKRQNRPDYPCTVCNQWQSIEQLLHNAPAARPNPLVELMGAFAQVQSDVKAIGSKLATQHGAVIGRFDKLDDSAKELMIKIEDAYTHLIRTLLDEAKEGPRLFSFEPVATGFFNLPSWVKEKFRITLWCEHSRLPLTALPPINGKDVKKNGVYEVSLTREWLVQAAPFLKVLAGTLSLVVPVAASAAKLSMEDAAFKGIEKQLDLGQKSLDSVITLGGNVGSWLGKGDAPDLEHGREIRADGSALRQLQSWLKEKDPGFGELIKVQNKRREFLWVHPQFEKEY